MAPKFDGDVDSDSDGEAGPWPRGCDDDPLHRVVREILCLNISISWNYVASNRFSVASRPPVTSLDISLAIPLQILGHMNQSLSDLKNHSKLTGQLFRRALTQESLLQLQKRLT